jgi:biotin transport system substrate-specific component
MSFAGYISFVKGVIHQFNRSTNTLARIGVFAAVIAASAFLRIPLGPVPLTLQSTAALLCGYCLGPSRGAAATLLYTGIGLAGLPVFTTGGGPGAILSPTFGYILGFTACAFVVGFLADRIRRRTALSAYLFMLGGLVCLYIPGVIWLYIVLRHISNAPPDIAVVLETGLAIPFAGDLLKTIPAAVIGPRIRRFLDRRDASFAGNADKEA